ncbi:MAG: family 78 glycoside hydrolase catalytic domain [Armatimonadetes bacterium]|nr:family 78 glycoside hydrolase catalytic domain [Armatimonadota bacterium]MDE2205013.1 family 78 glycoside hydrolase catalytic domain [Armatimonadota bacterium]
MLIPPAAALHPVNLTCDYRHNPIGIDDTHPRFSWIDSSPRRDQFQGAWQVLVASSPLLLSHNRGDLWNSGRVASGTASLITYSGRALTSERRAWWKVRVWNRAGQPSAFSPAARFEMGLLRPSDWHAKWIGMPALDPAAPNEPVALLRTSFILRGRIRSARWYGTALGLYQLQVNGMPATNGRLRPGWTDYHLRIPYQTLDVTRLLRPGVNAVGIRLAAGWYAGYVGFGHRRFHYGNAPRAYGQLVVRYRDGTKTTVSTGPGWAGAYGPTLGADLLMGDLRDSRREMPGWCVPVMMERWNRHFGAVQVDATPSVKQPPGTRPAPACDWPGNIPLTAESDRPVERVAAISPKVIRETAAGWVVDFGQNMVGVVHVRAFGGHSGERVTMRFGEVLNPDGSVYTTNLRGARATDVWILNGAPMQQWEPQFTFHGFRYAQITGWPGALTSANITGIVLSSARPDASAFECTNHLVNQLQHNIQWGMRGNYLEVPTDCPQRDERLGWMGDAEVFAPTACDNANVAAFLGKWMDDVDDAQSAAGGFSDVSPRLVDPADGAPAWGDAGVIVPWTLYRAYGDKRVVADHYPAMVRWLNYIRSANPDLLWVNRSNNNFGDWLNVGDDTDRALIATAFFARDADLMARMARAIGKVRDAAMYHALFQQIAAAFDRKWLLPDGAISGGTQTSYVIALQFHLLPPAARRQAAADLVAAIRKRGWHLSTGFIGTGSICQVLTDAGYADVAWRLVKNTTYPSWGYEIARGATTIWERWDGIRPNGTFEDPGMNSFNHYAFGAVGRWLIEDVAGIQSDAAHPGYAEIILNPLARGGVRSASSRIETIHGEVASAWRQEKDRFIWKVTIPANTWAEAHIPAQTIAGVTEGRRSIARAPGIHVIGMAHGALVVTVPSGSWSFHSTVPTHRRGALSR